VKRFGSTTARKLLAAFGTVEAAWQATTADLRSAVGELAATHFAAPASRDLIDRNRSLMAMRADLPLPGLAAARLPLSYATMRQALRARDINLGPSLWALVDGTPPASPAPDESPELRPWVFKRGLTARRDPTPGQLSLF
jgi:DNA polymerase-1